MQQTPLMVHIWAGLHVVCLTFLGEGWVCLAFHREGWDARFGEGGVASRAMLLDGWTPVICGLESSRSSLITKEQ